MFFGGIGNNISLFYLLIITLFLTITSSKYHLLIILVIVINVIALYFAQNHGWFTIAPEPNSETSLLQLGIFVLIISTYGFMIGTIKKLYLQVQENGEHALGLSNLQNQELAIAKKEIKKLLDEAIIKNREFEQIQVDSLQNMKELTKSNKYLEDSREELENTLEREQEAQLALNVTLISAV